MISSRIITQTQRHPPILQTLRTFAIKRRVFDPRYDTTEIAPGHTIDAVKPPDYWTAPPPLEPDPMRHVRQPVTSVHAIDLDSNGENPKLSLLDAIKVEADGKSVVHGRYGKLEADVLESVPLEYLALLHPAAWGTAAVRTLTASSPGTPGTLLLYGASQPSGLAALQMATANNLSTIAVLDGQHAGNIECLDTIKNLAAHPGTAVTQEYAFSKANFRDLVQECVTGGTPPAFDPAKTFLPKFQENLLAYIDMYPPDDPNRPPYAVNDDLLEFTGKEKDREHFRDNVEAYLEQFSPAPPRLLKEELEKNLDVEKYGAWKYQFGHAYASILSGEEEDEVGFEPGQLVKDVMHDATKQTKLLQERKDHEATEQAMDKDVDMIGYQFNPLRQYSLKQYGVQQKKGGPIVGAVIVETPELKRACEAVAGKKTVREMAEALQFLPEGERVAFGAACSVAGLAEKEGKPVLVLGELPGMKSVEQPTPQDVQTALSAMELEEDGESSKLNFFLQVYRASDYPIYASYALHRSTEAMAGPRTFVVTK